MFNTGSAALQPFMHGCIKCGDYDCNCMKPSPERDDTAQAGWNRENKKTFATGAIRCEGVAGDTKPTRYDLLSPIAIRRVAETYAEGAAKYNDHNWRAGMPFSSTINHCLAHIYQYLKGDTTEDHLAHAAWNLFALMHFEETHPEQNDLKVDDYKKPEYSINDYLRDIGNPNNFIKPEDF